MSKATPPAASAATSYAWRGPVTSVPLEGRDLVLHPGRPVPEDLPQDLRSVYIAAGYMVPASQE